MHSFRLSHILVCLLLLCPGVRITGQVDEKQLDRWIEMLSAKKDPKFQRYRAVVKETQAIAPAHYCDAMKRLVHKAVHANVYCQIRISHVHMLAYNTEEYHCAEQDSLLLWGDPLHLAYALDDPFLIAMGHRLHTGNYRLKREYGLATMHLMLAIEIQDSLGTEHFFDRAFDRYMLGELKYHSRDYEGAIRSFEEALKFHEAADIEVFDPLDTTTLMFMYNTIGLSYDRLGQYDKAFAAYDKAIQFAADSKYPEHWIPLIKGNRGDIFYKLGQYDSAYVLLEQDVASSLAGGPAWADNAATSMQYMARIKIKRGQVREGLAGLHEARGLLKGHYNSRVQSHIYYGFMEAFERLNQSDSLLYYTQQYIAVHDSLERKATEARAEIVQVRLDNQNSIDRIKALSKEKKNIAMIRNFIILLTVLLFAFGLLYYIRERLKMKLHQQRALEDARNAEAEAKAARAQLTTFTQHLLEKNALVETLQEQLTSKEFNDEQVQAISALSQHAILTDEDWNQFRVLFEKVYPGFIHQIRTMTPDITSAELRIAALSKLRISSREGSNLLGISPASVNKTRQRLRHRLGLDQGTDLDEYFNGPGF